MAWKQKRNGGYIELRNTYNREVPYSAVTGRPARPGTVDRKVYDYGQILVKVGPDTVRLSMNGPCNLLPTQWETMKEWIESAQQELREERDGTQTS